MEKRLYDLNNFMKSIRLSSIASFILWSSCSGILSDTTPIKYKNTKKVAPVLYNKHLKILNDSIKSIIADRRFAYYPTDNDSNTTIIIDTILYSPQLDKVAFFVITKKTVRDSANSGDGHQFHYDGNAFISRLSQDTIFTDINWISATMLSNYFDLEETSSTLRQIYLNRFNQRQDTMGHNFYKYNLDDVRFWTGPIWKKMININAESPQIAFPPLAGEAIFSGRIYTLRVLSQTFCFFSDFVIDTLNAYTCIKVSAPSILILN